MLINSIDENMLCAKDLGRRSKIIYKKINTKFMNMTEQNYTNTLYTNDNLFIINGMNSNLVDLIYLVVQ